ncbi:hypothetical protein ACIRL2_32665 [Embleya sp. NPDC127516]|uniref:hypothetical protein n=1 Tax=Embleya sp. NPDC127516 TaxID=3363990 RepID=UPI0037F69F26
MNDSLIVAIVGVVGTLAAGVFAQRGAMKSKIIELRHAERMHIDTEAENARRAHLEARRQSYGDLNQALRDKYTHLLHHWRTLKANQTIEPSQVQVEDESEGELRAAYAKAQMIAADNVIELVGPLVQRLYLVHRVVRQHDRGETPDENLDALKAHIDKAAEMLYEVRQVMRRDLGITELPLDRPPGYGSVPR